MGNFELTARMHELVQCNLCIARKELTGETSVKNFRLALALDQSAATACDTGGRIEVLAIMSLIGHFVNSIMGALLLRDFQFLRNLVSKIFTSTNNVE